MASTQIIGGIGGQYDIVFDAAKDYTLQFLYTGNQVVKNRIIINDNASNATVFDNTVVTMAKRHTIPAGTLVNGTTYNIAIQVWYRDDEFNEVADDVSDTVLARCYSTPEVMIDNMPMVVRNATFDFAFTYNQAEGDLLDWYRIYVYDSGHTLMYAQDVVYPAADAATHSFTVRISDLFDGQQYAIRCVAVSVAGMETDTGLLDFAVEYVRPLNYALLFVENAPSICSTQVWSNIKIISGYTRSGDEPEYIDGEKLDLRNGDWVFWQDMIDIVGDFQVLLRLEDFNECVDVLKLANGKNTITLKAMQGMLDGQSSEKAYMLLYVDNGFFNYVVTSNLIDPPAPDESLLISMTRRGYLYELQLTNEGVM